MCRAHQDVELQTGNDESRRASPLPCRRCLHPQPCTAPAREAVLQPRHIERGCPAEGLPRLRPCKTQEPTLGVRDECQTGRLHPPRQSEAGVGPAASQSPAVQAERVERGTREQAEPARGRCSAGPAWLWAPGLPAGDSALALAGRCVLSRRGRGPRAARRLGTWAIHGQRRGPR